MSNPVKNHTDPAWPARASTLDAVIAFDAQRRVVLITAGAERLFRCSATQALNSPIDRFIRGMSNPATATGVTTDGVEFPIELEVSQLTLPGSDGTSAGAAGTAAKIQILCIRDAKTAQAQERARALLASIIEPSSDAIISKDLRGIVTSWNAGAAKMFGYRPEEMIGQPISLIIPEGLRADDHNVLAKISRGEPVEPFETERRHKSGRMVQVSVTVSPIRDPLGQVIGASKVIRDITARKKLDETLREARDTLSLLIDQAPVSIAMFDCDMRYMAVSRRWIEEFGGGHKELVGHLLYESMPVTQYWRDIHQRGLAGETLRSDEDSWIRFDGAMRWVRWAIHPWRRGAEALGGLIMFAEDVTEKKMAAGRVRQSEAHFRQVAESLPQLIWATNPAGEFDFLSRQWATYTGMTDTPKLQKTLIDQIHPEDRSHLLKTWFGSVASGNEFHAEFRIRRHDGRYRLFDSRGTPLRDETGKIVRWFGANTDIEDQKIAREGLLRRQKMEALGTLAGGIAHDFNNILSAIRGNATLALEDTDPGHPSRQSLLEIDRAAMRATDLVKRILAFSRQEEPRRLTIHLQGVIEEAIKLLRATLPARIELRTSIAPDTPPTMADSSQVHQILLNLLTNSAHAIGSRPGVIGVNVSSVTIDEQTNNPALSPGRYACLTVTDNGSGMSKEIQERIFDPFFTTKPPGEGTGLGLSVVDGIIKSHGGAVTVYSEPDKGTTFRLFFPAAQGMIESDTVKLKAIAAARGKRVLYVDDDEALVMLTTRKLKRMGYVTTGESNPLTALKRLKDEPDAFDAVVTDLSMPHMTGFDLAREILALRPELPVLLTSGFVRPEDQENANRIGIRALIVKPNTIEDLGVELDRIFSTLAPVAAASSGS